MATRGDAGDAPVLKMATLPSGEGKFYGEGSSARGDLKAKAASYTGVDPEIHPVVEFQIPACNYAGVGPLLAAGVYCRPAAGSFAGVDHMAVAGHFSSLSGNTNLYTFKPLIQRTVQLPVELQSPREYRTATLIRNSLRKARVLRREYLEMLLDKREDRKRLEAERFKLDDEKKKFEDEKKTFEEKRFEEEKKRFAEEKKRFEDEKKRFEEEKKQFPQKAVAVEDEKKETIPWSKIDTADQNLSLFEKVINVPRRAEQIGKTMEENTQLVKKRLVIIDAIQKMRKVLGTLGTSAIWIFKDELKESIGIRGGDSSEGSTGGDSNGMLNEGKSGGQVPKVVAAANGAGNGAPSVPKVASALGNGAKCGAPTGVDTGDGGGVADSATGAGVADSATGSRVVDSATGAGVADSATSGGVADSATGTGVAHSATGAGGVTGAPVGTGPKGV